MSIGEIYTKMETDWNERAKADWIQSVCTGCTETTFWESGQAFASSIIDKAGIKPSDRVLDFGCGPGRLAIPLSLYCEVIGADISTEMLAIMQAHAPAMGSRLRALQTRSDGRAGFSIPLRGGSVDWIVDRLVTKHVPHNALASAIVGEWRRVLSRGGCLLTDMFTSRVSEAQCQESIKMPNSDTWTSRHYTRDYAESLLRLTFVAEVLISGVLMTIWKKP